MRIQRPARLTSRPRLRCQPIVINSNSARWASRAATQPRSSANDLPGVQLGTRSTPVKHPQSFTSSPLSQHPLSAANRNVERRSRLDHHEIRGVYKPARNDPREDSTANRQRDNFSGFGLSSPALQQPPTKPFSGSPSRQHLTDPTRETREAGRQRPGIVYPLPRAARTDTRLVIDAALPEAAALDRCEQPPTVVDIPEPGRTTGDCLPGPLQQCGSRSPRRHSRKWPRNRSSGVYRPIPYRQEDHLTKPLVFRRKWTTFPGIVVLRWCRPSSYTTWISPLQQQRLPDYSPSPLLFQQ